MCEAADIKRCVHAQVVVVVTIDIVGGGQSLIHHDPHSLPSFSIKAHVREKSWARPVTIDTLQWLHTVHSLVME